MVRPCRIDCLQYANWSEKIFRQMREGCVDAVHVTISYHENFRETVQNIEAWNRWFELFPRLAERKDQSSRVSLRVVAPTAAHLDAIVEGLDRIGAPTIALG